MCRVYRQRRDIKVLAVWRSSGDTGCGDDTKVVEPTQFLYRRSEVRLSSMAALPLMALGEAAPSTRKQVEKIFVLSVSIPL